MATFPTSVVALTNPATTDKLNSPSHATQHINANNEIEAVETSLLALMGSSGFTTVKFNDSPTTEYQYVVLPYVGTISAKGVVYSGTTGTGATVTIYQSDTAGSDLVVGTFTSAGTPGQQVLSFTSGTSGITSVAAGSAVCCFKASCATSYGCQISIFVARTA